MMAPHTTHYMAADSMHAERLANAARVRLARTQLHPHSAEPRVQLRARRLSAVLASLVMAVVLATAVSAAANTEEAGPVSPNAAAAGGHGAGGAVLVR